MDIAVIVAVIALEDPRVAASVLVPAVGPSFQDGTITVPSIEDVEAAEELAKLPPPPVTANTTCSPGRGLPTASRILTIRVGIGFTTVPAGALSPDPFRTTMLTAFPGRVDAGVPGGGAVAEGVAVEFVGVPDGVEVDVGFAASPFTMTTGLDAGTSDGADSATDVHPATAIETTMRPGRARAHHVKRDMRLASREAET